MKIKYLILLCCFPLTGYGAALPFTGNDDARTKRDNDLSSRVSITTVNKDDLDRVKVRLTNTATGDTLEIFEGNYDISPGEYDVLAFKPQLDDIDDSYQQYRTTVNIRSGELKSLTIPYLKKRRFTSWHDYLTVSFQMATIGDDYEVSSILNEFYTKQNISNSYPEINAISQNDGDAQSRSGLSLNYKHMFANSDWMFYADYFLDRDGDSNLNRSGFGVGAGKYWDSQNSTYWLAGGVGSENAAWNDITVGGNSSISISGDTDNQTVNAEAGIIYRPFNLSASARLDLINQTVTFNIGYLFGGKKQGYIDSAFIAQ
jgi:hypothetical protein